MGEVATSILASTTVSAWLVAAFVWFSRTWISERLKNAIKHEYDVALEAHKVKLKAEFDKEIETLKAQLKAESDKEVEILKARLKAEADVATEKLKAELHRSTAEHQIRFARLHEKVAETVAETYCKLGVIRLAVSRYTKILEYKTDPSNSLSHKGSSAR